MMKPFEVGDEVLVYSAKFRFSNEEAVILEVYQKAALVYIYRLKEKIRVPQKDLSYRN